MSCDSDDIDNEIIKCWCGAEGTYEELFDNEVYERNCGGTGTLHCECGGDFCVCHHHGEVECDGCEDCRDLDRDDYNEKYVDMDDYEDDYGDEDY